MSKKQKTTSSSTTNTNVTSTPTNPTWVDSSVQGLQTKINGLLDTDASTLVPGASQLQTKAFEGAQGLGGWKDGLASASAGAQGVLDGPAQATSRSLLDVNLDGYMNPYLDSVVNTTLAGFDEKANMERAQLAAQQAQGQKFSGSGAAIERALFNRGSIQDRAGTEAGLRSAGYDKATGLATADLNREAQTSQFNASQSNASRLQAAGLLGELSGAEAANNRADLGLLGDMGDEQRDIEREKLGANTELLKLVSALNASQPYGLFRGETRTGTENSNSTSTTKTSDPMGAISGLLGAAGSAASGLGAMGVVFSDKRLKEDIETEGKDAAGRRVVSYRYKGEPKEVRRVGHIAQEVRKTDPHAVKKVGKHYAIDYGLLGDVA